MLLVGVLISLLTCHVPLYFHVPCLVSRALSVGPKELGIGRGSLGNALLGSSKGDLVSTSRVPLMARLDWVAIGSVQKHRS